MFGISFTEILLILAVALVVVGPQKLPQVLGTIGRYIGKLRRISSEVRRQTGIDDILRAEGLSGGLTELRGMMRGDFGSGGQGPRRSPAADPYDDYVEYDRTREYPIEGPDAYGAIPEDLAGDLDESPVVEGEDMTPAPSSTGASTEAPAATSEDKPTETKASA